MKDNTQYRVVESRQADKENGVLCDQVIRLTGVKSAKAYPEKLRRVKFRDPEKGDLYEFLTNNFTLEPLLIAQLYKQRWQVELFFKWIKQHLHIKAFYGTSENSVRVQVWTAISAYVLLAIVRKRLGLPQELHTMTQILRLHLFAKTPVLSLFFDAPEKTKHPLLVTSWRSLTNIRTAVTNPDNLLPGFVFSTEIAFWAAHPHTGGVPILATGMLARHHIV